MQKIRTAIFLGVTAVVIFVVVLALLSVKNFFTKDNGTQYKVSTKTVIKELRELNRLETAAFTIEKAIDAGTSGNRFQEILFGDRILLIAHGEVIAGFDLSRIREEDVTINDSTLSVTLPEPQILVTDLDNKETRVYDRRRGLLTRGNDELEAKARQAAEEEIREAACQGNILGEASANARSQLTALFKAFGFSKVEIIIPQGTC